jgi:ribonuclease P protein component
MSTFKKHERLSSQKQIAKLVQEGNTFLNYPFRVLWSISKNEHSESFHMQVAFSVPKRKFKKAVTRNTIRRRMREAFRLNKDRFNEEMEPYPFNLSILIIYTPARELHYNTIEAGMKKNFEILKKALADKTQ